MECDGDNLGSNQGFDVNFDVGKIRVEKMDVEKLGKKKRFDDVKVGGGESDDNEPIGSLLFKVKSRKNPKKVKVECDGGSKDQELGGLDDTLAAFRKKLKKGPRVCAPKEGDLDIDVKNVELAAKSEIVGKERNGSEDGIVESVKKGSKGSRKEKKKTHVKKKTAGENLTQNDLEDSLSAFLLKAQSGSHRKSKKELKYKQAKTTQASHDGLEQKPNGPVTVEIEANERLTGQTDKDPTGNNVINDD